MSWEIGSPTPSVPSSQDYLTLTPRAAAAATAAAATAAARPPNTLSFEIVEGVLPEAKLDELLQSIGLAPTKMVGKGTFGEVWGLAGGRVAKAVRFTRKSSEKNFAQEVRFARRMGEISVGPRIFRAIHVIRRTFKDGDVGVLVMEQMQMDLLTYIHQHPGKEEEWGPLLVFQLLEMTTARLGCLDLKSGNVMVDVGAEGQVTRLCLIDFGANMCFDLDGQRLEAMIPSTASDETRLGTLQCITLSMWYMNSQRKYPAVAKAVCQPLRLLLEILGVDHDRFFRDLARTLPAARDTAVHYGGGVRVRESEERKKKEWERQLGLLKAGCLVGKGRRKRKRKRG